MQQTVSGEMTLIIFKDTKFVSCNFYTYLVKILLMVNNPQVTKAFDLWVGTSEHIRLLSVIKYRNKYNNN